MKTTGEHLQEVKARIPTSRILTAPRQVNRESDGYTLVDDTGLVIGVFHADSPDLERQWAAFLRRAARDMGWLCKELENSWRREKRRRIRADDPLSILLTDSPKTGTPT